MRFFPFFLLSLLFTSKVYAQKEANIWYFGGQTGPSGIGFLDSCAGLNFNNNPPTPLVGGRMATLEGCASISDKNTGNILFYTDGRQVFDATHAIMPNGTGLKGSSTSTQSAVIIPIPESDSLYYIFAVDGQAGILPPPGGSGSGGVTYSIVDMSLNNGLGDVTSTKNITLVTPTPEKLVGIKHCNGKDIWVITQKWDTDSIYAFLVSKNGIAPAVISKTGAIQTGGTSNVNSLGYLKASLDGKMIASANYSLPSAPLELFSFDNSTGVISLITSFTTNVFETLIPYGVSFSPDNKKLYVSAVQALGGVAISSSRAYQFDLSSTVATDIFNSKTTLKIYNTPSVEGVIGAVQIGPDGKIYLAKSFGGANTGLNFIDVIEKPNELGTACNYIVDGISIGRKKCAFGLPNFVENFLSAGAEDGIKYTYPSCLNYNSISFSSIANNFTLWKWNFGDPESGSLNTDTLAGPNHNYSKPGSYVVTLILSNNCISDTLEKTINIPDTIGIGADSKICIGIESTVLDVNANFDSYLWSTGATTNSIQVSSAGKYIVTIKNANCTWTDSVDLVRKNCIPILPNIFTPNKDSKNDVFFIEGLPEVNELLIFNRWGNKIFEELNYKNNWEGVTKTGTDLADGVYYYVLKYGEDSVVNGYFHLIRN